jgi:nitrate reductase NapE component
VTKENKLLLDELKKQTKALSRVSGRFKWNHMAFLFMFAFLFAAIGVGGEYEFLLWWISLCIIIDLFKTAIDLADAGY